MKRFLLFIFLVAVAYFMTSNAGKFEKIAGLQTHLLRTDTAKLTRILIYPKAEVKTELAFNREENGWIATHLTQNIRVDEATMQQILTSLANIKPNRVIAKEAKDWKKYGVDVRQSTRVSAFVGTEKVVDFILGKSSSNNSGGRITSFIRIENGEETFEVEGLYAHFTRQFVDYRNSTILNLNPKNIQQLYLQNESVSLDSSQLVNYLQDISTIESNNFVNNFDEVAAANNLLKTLTIHLDNQPNPVKISLYFDSTAVKPFIIHSSLNKDAYFASDSAGIYAQIFQPLENN